MTTQHSTTWRKSSFSGSGGTGGGDCVEAAFFPDHRVGLRDSKNKTATPLTVPRSALTALVQHTRC